MPRSKVAVPTCVSQRESKEGRKSSLPDFLFQVPWKLPSVYDVRPSALQVREPVLNIVPINNAFAVSTYQFFSPYSGEGGFGRPVCYSDGNLTAILPRKARLRPEGVFVLRLGIAALLGPQRLAKQEHGHRRLLGRVPMSSA